MTTEEEQTHVITRQELYDRVWTTPLRLVAKEFGVTELSVIETCDYRQIPRPEKDYWIRIWEGVSVANTPQPSLEGMKDDHITFYPNRISVSGLPPITVSETLIEPHRLIVQTPQRSPRKAAVENEQQHRVIPSCLPVCVSPGTADRVLRIFDALFKYWEAIGGTIKLVNEKGSESPTASFALYEEHVSVLLSECRSRVIERRPQPGYIIDVQYVNVFNGRLKLELLRGRGPSGRGNWTDGVRQKLEDVLGVFVLEIKLILEKAERERIPKLIAAEERRRKEEADAIWRKLEQERRYKEQQRISVLDSLMKDWARAQDVRKFAAAARERAAVGCLKIEKEDSTADWLEWLESYADSIDPLVTGTK